MRDKRGWKGLILLIAFILLFFIGIVSTVISNSNIDKKLEGEEEISIIVILKDKPIEQKEIFGIAEKEIFQKRLEAKKIMIKAQQNKVLSRLNLNTDFKLKHKYATINGFSGKITRKNLEKLESDLDIKSIHINKLFHITLDQSISQINADDAWAIQLNSTNITGKYQTICILDTGVDYHHIALGNGWGNKVIAGYDYVNSDTDPMDDNGHGTHVAGIAASNDSTYRGTAPDANLVAIKVLDNNGDGNGGDIMAGIDWCVNNAYTYNISVISMSLGDCSNHSTYCNNDPLASSINSAVGQGIVVTVAAGNCNPTDCPGIPCTSGPSSPACVENATAIGTVNDADSIFYQRGALFELLAPGRYIHSTQLNGGFVDGFGTSMSAPHAAGAVALIQQFSKLQNGTSLTSAQIKNVLNDTGELIDDTGGSGYNFSRIDIYAAILSLDETAPSVTLVSPSNEDTSLNVNQTFTCNATDLQLSNVTFYLWNSSGGIVNQTSTNISGTFNETEFNVTNLEMEKSYEWNCLATDAEGNSAYADSNFTLTIGNISVSLTSPTDNDFTNQAKQNFTCLSQTASIFSLSNVTFYLWNSSGDVIYNKTENIGGTSNTTIFNYTFSEEGQYYWNCLAYNNVSQSNFAESNYTISYDSTKPDITSVYPQDGYSKTSSSASINFQFNVSDVNEIINCTLYLSSTPYANQSYVNKSLTNNISVSGISPESYNWQINCTDQAGNENNSATRSFTINSPIVYTPSGGGGGGTSYNIYSPTKEQTSRGYTKELRNKDKIKFTIFDEKAEQHTVVLDYTGKNFVNLTIQSEIIKLVLGIGQSAKLNLTSPDYYDLYMKLEEIVSNKAKLTIQTIHDPIVREIVKIKENITLGAAGEEEPEEKAGYSNYVIIIPIILLVVITSIVYTSKKGLKKKVKQRKPKIN